MKVIIGRKAMLFGILLIAGIVSGILSSVPALEYPDYLTELSAIKTHVLVAIFFQAVMSAVYVCIAALLYPIIKRQNEYLAVAYFGFRIIGAAFLFLGIASLVLLLSLSQSFASSAHSDLAYFQTIGELLRTGRDLINHIGMILPWSLGGLILYYCMFKMQLVPKWLSIWGIVGSLLTIIVTIMLMLGLVKIVTPTYFLMNAPTAFFEVSFAVYLIVKGFNPTVAYTRGSAGQS
jgi:hypothetical protein